MTMTAFDPSLRHSASATLAMLLADSRLPAGAHVSSNSLEAGLRYGLGPVEVADYMCTRMETVTRVEAGTAVIARNSALDRSGSAAGLEAVEAEWAARTPSAALREIAVALGAGLTRIGTVLWPQTNEVLRGRHMPRPIVLGVIAAFAGISADDLVRLVAYDDAQTVAAAMLKLEPTDPIRVTGWVLDACAAMEAYVADLSMLTHPAALPAAGAPLIEDWAEAQSALPRRLFRA